MKLTNFSITQAMAYESSDVRPMKKSFNDTETQISVSSPQNAKTAKLMWWSGLTTLKPISDAQGIKLD